MPTIYVSSEDSDTDANIMANVKTYVEEMFIKFITGGESIEKFDKFVQQVEEFGIKQAQQFRQDAYKRYLER